MSSEAARGTEFSPPRAAARNSILIDGFPIPPASPAILRRYSK